MTCPLYPTGQACASSQGAVRADQHPHNTQGDRSVNRLHVPPQGAGPYSAPAGAVSSTRHRTATGMRRR